MRTTCLTTRSGAGRRVRRSSARRGFTLTELLVVIAIIGILLSIILVAFSGVIGSARQSRTSVMLRGIGQGIGIFENDLGYAPPLVLRENASGGLAEGVLTPDILQERENLGSAELADVLRDARYSSEYSIAVYLLGIGRVNPDVDDSDRGVDDRGSADHDGQPGFGIKSPGPTRAWLNPSDLDEVQPIRSGRTYGPYLDLGTLEDFLRYDEERELYVIDDPFGNPIRYYRDWPISDTGAPSDAARVTLARTPPELLSAAVVDRVFGADQDLADIDPGLDRDLMGAEYALLSAGASSDEYVTSDEGPLAPFGDRLVGEDGRALTLTIEASGADLSPIDTQRLQEQFLEMIESNVRYTP